MREILFRAKRTDNDEWVYGTPYQDYNKFWGEWEWVIQTKHPKTNVPYLHLTVYKKTISEFTGLTDKNGEKIFEGDIVDVDGIAYRCRWDECNFEFGLVNEKESFGIAYAPHSIEIIGNIYDDPKWLEVTDNA